MRKSKRIFSFAVAFSLVASLAVYAPTVFSDSSSSNEAFEYEINEDGESITITSYRGLGGSVLNPGTIVGRESNIYPLSSVRGFIPAGSIYKKQGEVVTKR